jgi:hypothetical protein
MAKTKIPVFLGCDPLAFPDHNPIAVGYLDDETNTVSITVDIAKVTEALPQLIEIGQVRGLSFNLVYASAHKKENVNGG